MCVTITILKSRKIRTKIVRNKLNRTILSQMQFRLFYSRRSNTYIEFTKNNSRTWVFEIKINAGTVELR